MTYALTDLDAQALDGHAKWLAIQSRDQVARFDERRKNASEAALLEARSRELLIRQVQAVPGEKFNGGGPDFECVSAAGETRFFVECSVIRTDTATRKTGLTNESRAGPRNHRSWSGAIKDKLGDAQKSRQIGNALLPTLLICGTFHGPAGVVGLDPILVEYLLCAPNHECVLTTWNSQSACWESLFRGVSGLILLGLSARQVVQQGILTPNARQPFDPIHLPDFRFCRVRTWPTSQPEPDFEWVCGRPSISIERDGDCGLNLRSYALPPWIDALAEGTGPTIVNGTDSRRVFFPRRT